MWITAGWLEPAGLLVQVGAAAVVGTGVYLGGCLLLRVEELRVVTGLLRGRPAAGAPR